MYGHIRCIYTVLANPIQMMAAELCALLLPLEISYALTHRDAHSCPNTGDVIHRSGLHISAAQLRAGGNPCECARECKDHRHWGAY